MTLRSNRRTFLQGAGLALAATAVTFRPGRARAATRLTLGHGAAPGNPRTVAAEAFAKMVTERTNGEVVVTIAGSEQLGNDVSMLTSMRTGALDLTANSQGAASGLVPEIAALGLPFIFRDAAQAHQVLQGPIGATLVEKFTAVGLIPLDWWDNGIRHTTNAQKSIETPADLSGMSIRTPADPVTVDIFQALGAATQQIPFGELYIALQQGVVDGQENPLANIASAKLFEVNRFITLTGHQWQSTPFLMSQFAKAKVTPEQLEIIQAAAKEAGDLQRRLMAEADVKVLAEFKANPDLVVNAPDRAPFQAATASVIEKYKGESYGDFVSEVLAAAGAAG
jgi:tripartite ATP-independent transporter DctP family solute receptor